jgi:hypothetical protein
VCVSFLIGRYVHPAHQPTLYAALGCEFHCEGEKLEAREERSMPTDENAPTTNLTAAGIDLAAKHGTQLRRTDLKKDYSEDYKAQYPQAEQMAKTGEYFNIQTKLLRMHLWF